MEKIKPDKIKLLKRTILVVLLLTCIGVFIAHKFAQRYGFDGIGELISVYRHNQNLADQVQPQEMQLLLSDSDYDFLKQRRDIAIERGIQINDGEDNYVECKIVQGTDTIKGEMRLKGHMTDHLEGEKWSFRVKTKKKPVFGMTRFSLQAPGTRNYAYEWVYHQLLKQEGIIYLNYDFIKLKLNEKDLGIYAIEEHFGQHVLEHNDRPAGAILRWNPNLYWEGRIDELQGTYIDQQYSGYASSFVEPYEKGAVEDDPILVETYTKGAQLLEAFRRGEKKTSEVFDIEKMAGFHAIIDLVGGHHSLDWSDVKFFYNSQTGKVEPVGYESFSVRKTESIAGQRIPDTYDQQQFNYHNQLFADPVFFAAYIQALERICSESYFHSFMNQIQPELDKKLGVLAYEFPYRKFTFDPYFENIELIRHNLELPKPFHAFLEKSNDSTIQISVTPVSDFPIEIISLSVDGKDEYELDSVFVLPAKARNTYAHYFNIEVRHDAKKIKNLKLKARIPGSLKIFEIEVSDLPSYRMSSATTISLEQPVDESDVGLTHLNDSVVYFNTKKIALNGALILRNHETLKLFPGQVLEFSETGRIICNGKIEMIGGSEDGEEILVKTVIKSNSDTRDSTINARIIIENGELTCANVSFMNTNSLIFGFESDMAFRNCNFADIDGVFMNTEGSRILIKNCASGSMNSIGNFDQSILRITNFIGKKGDIFLRSFGSDVDMLYCDFSGFQSIANLNYSSGLSAWSSVFSASETIAELNHASSFTMFGGEIQNAQTGFSIDQSTSLPGNSGYQVYKTKTESIKQLETR